MYDVNLKAEIYQKAFELGAKIVRNCSVSKWETMPFQKPEFWPQNIWPWAKSVIVLAIPLIYPMAATAPSMVYKELYDTSNRIMDNMGYFFASYINTEKKYRALYFPRDCYDGMESLLRHGEAAFSHVIAGYYAGVGTIGDSHNLITREFGPRIRLVSVITDAPIEPDGMIEGSYCIHCGLCLKKCPAQCFKDNGKRDLGIYHFEKDNCTRHHIDLIAQHRFPCGYFCPVGEDLKLYKGEEVVSAKGIRHCQTYGS